MFCKTNIKKVIHWVGEWGEWGNLISSWKCKYSIYLDIQVNYMDIQVNYMDIQAISTLLCLLLVLDVLVPSID